MAIFAAIPSTDQVSRPPVAARSDASTAGGGMPDDFSREQQQGAPGSTVKSPARR